MLPFDANPVLAEARELADERRTVRLALAAHRGRPTRPGQAADADDASPLVAELSDELDAVESRLDALLADPEHRAEIGTALTERARTLRIAVSARAEELTRRARLAAAARTVDAAVAAARPLTRGERHRVARLRAETRSEARAPEERGADPSSRHWSDGIRTPERRDGVLDALAAMRLREARDQLRDGLLLTEQMREIIAEALPAILRGDPVLLVGETGGAKTALAEHLARRGIGREPELVSGYGDITSAQLIGTHELRSEGGATVSAFVPGPLLRAMTEGRPVILDEINAMPPEFLKRLNRILQLRPGDEMGVQEDAGRRVRIAPGFAIIATANEQTPHRYRGLDRLSAELVNRFGANGYRVRYPDSGLAYEQFPVENGLLAAAAVVDSRGALPFGLTADELIRVARAAFISQQVFAGEHGGGFGDYVSTEREIDGRPGLEEAVLAPRTLVAILQKVAGSAGGVTLERALERFVESVMHREDRRVLGLILEGQGFRVG
ncbi:AAA family ATPase [Leucobacter ruminantium]|uniref:AAA family ATPase n=1 Tax=Leucobacter ruminantium TaxID=1289170 RepID=A0A939M060_9MICO|nr:AAA family ATPase [Leucobacter ruminantium]MBO1804645.1 AAA family ATPase [Leucobacter ruminantium]